MTDLQEKVAAAEVHRKQVDSELAATKRATNRIELEKESTISQLNASLEEQIKLVGQCSFIFLGLPFQADNLTCFLLKRTESLGQTVKAKEEQIRHAENMSKHVGDEASAQQQAAVESLNTRAVALEASLARERKTIQQLSTYESPFFPSPFLVRTLNLFFGFFGCEQ